VVDDRWFNEQGRFRGSVVHALCQLDNEGDLDESWIDEQENATELHGYLRAHRRMKEETGFVAIASEEQVYCSTLNYCGTLDERGPLNGKPCLADIKSGSVSRITRYQTVAYLGCMEQPWLWTRLAVALRPDGTYKLKVYGPQDYRKDWSRWQSIVDVYYLRRELGFINGINQQRKDNDNHECDSTDTNIHNGPDGTGVCDGDGVLFD
jgi:hypothetical protein